MLVPGPAKKIVIHLNGDTSSRHDFLYKEILALLLASGVAGATLLYPQGGFGSHHLMHVQGGGIDSDRHAPGRIEFIETAEKVDALLPALYELVTDGLIEAQDTIILKAALRDDNYFLTVQYPERQIQTLADLRSIPIRGPGVLKPTRLDMVSNISRIQAPTEVDHYQIRREVDLYVRPHGEDLGKIADEVNDAIHGLTVPHGIDITMRGIAGAMNSSFHSFAIGLSLSLLLLYLILVAQFRTFVDPLIILLAIPPGVSGVLLTLWSTGTTLNIMSLMGVVMLTGIAVSNSILIVDFAHNLLKEGSCRWL